MRRMQKLLLPVLILAIVLLACLSLTESTQAKDASPLSSTPQSLDTVETLVMPPMDIASLMAEDEVRAIQGLPTRFAQPIPVNITPWNHGTWESLADGSSLWRLRIISKGAISLNFGFTLYWMPEGGSLSFYAPDHSQVRGPFTADDNETHGQLWTPILLGEDIVIEVKLPTQSIDQLNLRLGYVNHGYREFGKPYYPESGACNLDVVCGAADGYPQVDAWREDIRSVAVISTGGSTFCSGFLVNDTAEDLKGYFMTANHCGINPGNAASLVTYWNYENSWCRPVNDPINGQPGDGTLNEFNAGSYFRAAYSASDFTLVELDDPINPAYNVYWAGWDATSGNASNAIGIHHPNTDEKRISFEDHPTSTTSYLGTSVPGDGTHVRITDWDLGTTEPGSSGSPLFNQDHHIIGQLHGGYAACYNDESDWYGRFSVSWDRAGSSPNNRLRDWLDAGNTGRLVQDGRNRVETPFQILAQPAELSICAPDSASYDITVTQEKPDYVNPVTLNLLGAPEGALTQFSVNPVTPTFTSTLTITQTEQATPGSYDMDLVGVDMTNTFTATIGLHLFNAPPGSPSLLTPADGAIDQSFQPIFTWEGDPFSSLYKFRLDTNPLYTQPILAEDLEEPTYTPQTPLMGGRCYWWGVQAQNTCGDGIWSESFQFATSALGVSFFDDLESGSGNWTHQATLGIDHWAIRTDLYHSPSHAWFVPDDSVITDTRLWITQPIQVGGGSELTFWHRYQFEGTSYDGSVLEISSNGGTTWTDLGPYITTNGYNGTISSSFSNPLGGRQGWTGDLTTWTKVSVNLSAFANQQVLIRWRLGCDSSQSDVGWYIDDVQITSPLPPNPAPFLSSITPDSGSNLVATPVVISGSGFINTPALKLGDTWLESVTLVDASTIHAVVPAGIPVGTYDLTINNGDCQADVLEAAYTVTEGDEPISGLEADNDSPTELGSTTTFTATITGGANVSYAWDFGDGTSGNGRVATHIYVVEGNYIATVTASNNAGSEAASTEVVVFNPIIVHYVYLPMTEK